MADGIPARLTARQGREFAFPVGGVFLLFSGFALWRSNYMMAPVFFVLSMLMLAAGAIVPGKLGPLYRVWMGGAHALSKITTPIFLGVVYFLVISPIGLAMRLLGRNPIRHRQTGGSHWFERNQPRGGMKDQF